MTKLLTGLLVLAACGGSSSPSTNAPTTPTTTAAHEQTFAEAVQQMCDGLPRAKADPEWQKTEGDTTKQPAVLMRHMQEGVTNARVLEWIDHAFGDHKGPGLAQITQEAGVTSCPVAEILPAEMPAD